MFSEGEQKTTTWCRGLILHQFLFQELAANQHFLNFAGTFKDPVDPEITEDELNQAKTTGRP